MKSSEGGSAGRCVPLALTGCLPDQAAHDLAAEQRLGRVCLDERARVEAARRDLDDAEQAAAAIPARIPLGTLTPDMARLDAETKQITHAIRMAAYNAETILARALHGHYARASDEAHALIREALTGSGDICPGNGELLIRLDPLTAPRRTQALAGLCDQLTAARACYPGTDLVLRYEVRSRPSPA